MAMRWNEVVSLCFRSPAFTLIDNSEEMIEIELNGSAHQVAASQSVEELIAELSLAGKAVAVAINREIVPRSVWAQRQLQAADRVDVVRAIGGG